MFDFENSKIIKFEKFEKIVHEHINMELYSIISRSDMSCSIYCDVLKNELSNNVLHRHKLVSTDKVEITLSIFHSTLQTLAYI